MEQNRIDALGKMIAEKAQMTAPDKPDIDAQIARAKRDVDLAAGWLAANQTDVEAQHNYQFCVSILATLEAHKRIIEAEEVPEPVWMQSDHLHKFRQSIVGRSPCSPDAATTSYNRTMRR